MSRLKLNRRILTTRNEARWDWLFLAWTCRVGRWLAAGNTTAKAIQGRRKR